MRNGVLYPAIGMLTLSFGLSCFALTTSLHSDPSQISSVEDVSTQDGLALNETKDVCGILNLWSREGRDERQRLLMAAFSDPTSAIRFAEEADRTIQCCIGINPTKRDECKELLRGIQDDTSRHPQTRTAACWLRLSLQTFEKGPVIESVKLLSNDKDEALLRKFVHRLVISSNGFAKRVNREITEIIVQEIGQTDSDKTVDILLSALSNLNEFINDDQLLSISDFVSTRIENSKIGVPLNCELEFVEVAKQRLSTRMLNRLFFIASERVGRTDGTNSDRILLMMCRIGPHTSVNWKDQIINLTVSQLELQDSQREGLNLELHRNIADTNWDSNKESYWHSVAMWQARNSCKLRPFNDPNFQWLDSVAFKCDQQAIDAMFSRSLMKLDAKSNELDRATAIIEIEAIKSRLSRKQIQGSWDLIMSFLRESENSSVAQKSFSILIAWAPLAEEKKIRELWDYVNDVVNGRGYERLTKILSIEGDLIHFVEASINCIDTNRLHSTFDLTVQKYVGLPPNGYDLNLHSREVHSRMDFLIGMGRFVNSRTLSKCFNSIARLRSDWGSYEASGANLKIMESFADRLEGDSSHYWNVFLSLLDFPHSNTQSSVSAGFRAMGPKLSERESESEFTLLLGVLENHGALVIDFESSICSACEGIKVLANRQPANMKSRAASIVYDVILKVADSELDDDSQINVYSSAFGTLVALKPEDEVLWDCITHVLWKHVEGNHYLLYESKFHSIYEAMRTIVFSSSEVEKSRYSRELSEFMRSENGEAVIPIVASLIPAFAKSDRNALCLLAANILLEQQLSNPNYDEWTESFGDAFLMVIKGLQEQEGLANLLGHAGAFGVSQRVLLNRLGESVSYNRKGFSLTIFRKANFEDALQLLAREGVVYRE